MKKAILILFLISAFNINAKTHIVTNSNDDGDGSLRKIVADASAGDSILFSSNVDSVVLTTGQIVINKNLTITGHSKDRKVILPSVTINRYFFLYL
jgi:hypothetical protein